MADGSKILILIANKTNATLCSNVDGVTRYIRTIECVAPPDDMRRPDEEAFDHQNVFVCELMMALRRTTDEHAYEGVVIFAEAPMMEDLRRVQTSDVARLIIARIVGVPSEWPQFSSTGAANLSLAHVGGLQ
jgi:hypothetical protein